MKSDLKEETTRTLPLFHHTMNYNLLQVFQKSLMCFLIFVKIKNVLITALADSGSAVKACVTQEILSVRVTQKALANLLLLHLRLCEWLILVYQWWQIYGTKSPLRRHARSCPGMKFARRVRC